MFVFMCINGFAQNDIKKDTIKKPKYKVYKTNYGLRFGADISKPILSLVNKNYKGLELVGDFRFARKWYVAGELGYESKTFSEEVINVSSSGKFIRLGANYNAYNNWMDMTNEIYLGWRYGYGRYRQKLNSYIPNMKSEYFPANEKTSSFEMPNLNIHWLEFQLGIKAETFKNLYVGFHFSYKIGLSIEQPTNFQAMYAPGFNRIYESKTGFGFNYTISYLIPFLKK